MQVTQYESYTLWQKELFYYGKIMPKHITKHYIVTPIHDNKYQRFYRLTMQMTRLTLADFVTSEKAQQLWEEFTYDGKVMLMAVTPKFFDFCEPFNSFYTTLMVDLTKDRHKDGDFNKISDSINALGAGILNNLYNVERRASAPLPWWL